MDKENLIALHKLCIHYKVEKSFFNNLRNTGLIKIIKVEETEYIHSEYIGNVEKIMRMQDELNINLEGIDVVFNLLQKIEKLEDELISVKNRLKLYED